ncbi:hypothetical protein ACQY0O_001452 [Thecaphora frezii]
MFGKADAFNPLAEFSDNLQPETSSNGGFESAGSSMQAGPSQSVADSASSVLQDGAHLHYGFQPTLQDAHVGLKPDSLLANWDDLRFNATVSAPSTVDPRTGQAFDDHRPWQSQQPQPQPGQTWVHDNLPLEWQYSPDQDLPDDQQPPLDYHSHHEDEPSSQPTPSLEAMSPPMQGIPYRRVVLLGKETSVREDGAILQGSFWVTLPAEGEREKLLDHICEMMKKVLQEEKLHDQVSLVQWVTPCVLQLEDLKAQYAIAKNLANMTKKAPPATNWRDLVKDGSRGFEYQGMLVILNGMKVKSGAEVKTFRLLGTWPDSPSKDRIYFGQVSVPKDLVNIPEGPPPPSDTRGYHPYGGARYGRFRVEYPPDESYDELLRHIIKMLIMALKTEKGEALVRKIRWELTRWEDSNDFEEVAVLALRVQENANGPAASNWEELARRPAKGFDVGDMRVSLQAIGGSRGAKRKMLHYRVVGHWPQDKEKTPIFFGQLGVPRNLMSMAWLSCN